MPAEKRSRSSSESSGSFDEFIEPYTHSFIVNIWIEETVAEAGRAIWRGHITHVTTGQRRYVTSLSGINDYFASYLTKMGIRPPFIQRLRYRLRLTQEKQGY